MKSILLVLALLLVAQPAYSFDERSPSLGRLVLAGILTSRSHLWGHVEQANQLGVPIKTTFNSPERWKTDDLKKDLLIHGAGFRAQDKLTRRLQYSDIAKESNFSNAVYKIWYLLDGPQRQGQRTKGDINNMARRGGNKQLIQLSLIASILADLHKADNPDRKWDLGFWQSNNGAPGLLFIIHIKERR